jgi:hypothetical protein
MLFAGLIDMDNPEHSRTAKDTDFLAHHRIKTQTVHTILLV